MSSRFARYVATETVFIPPLKKYRARPSGFLFVHHVMRSLMLDIQCKKGANMEEIKLYSARVCPFAHRCRLALAEKGLNYELIDIDLRNKPDWYKQINPAGFVPTLKQGEFMVAESLVINEYINDLADTPPLFPQSAQQKALARCFIKSTDTSFVPSFYRLLKAQTKQDQAKATDKMLAALQQINEALKTSTGPYLIGVEFSLADIAIYPWFERWAVLKHYRGLTIPDALDALQKWITTMHKRDSVKSNAEEDSFYIAEYFDYASGKK
jgi:glutathione S-transferase